MNATSNDSVTIGEIVTILMTGGSFPTVTGVLLGLL